jgi:hypothetical protein
MSAHHLESPSVQRCDWADSDATAAPPLRRTGFRAPAAGMAAGFRQQAVRQGVAAGLFLRPHGTRVAARLAPVYTGVYAGV